MPQETSQRVGDIQPGRIVRGKGIFIGKFDLTDACGKRLGLLTEWYDAAIDLGKPMTFYETARAVEMSNQNGRGGLSLHPMCYEADLFEKLKTGGALGKNVIAPLEVVRAIYELKNCGEYKRMSDRYLPGKLITTLSGTDYAHWQWSCTPCRDNLYGVGAVDFTDGGARLIHRDYYRFRVRTCFAQLAP
jgi:hypothetical protein